MRDIYDVQQQVGLAYLIQGRFKRVYQISGQLAYEPNRIRQKERQILNDDLAHRSVQRSEQLVLRKDFTFGKQRHQSGFSDIGISHQCHTYQTTAILALGGLLLVNLCQTFF